MVGYLIKTLVLAVFSFIIIYFYYFSNAAHIESFNGYTSYIIIVGIIYGIYKFFQIEFSDTKASFSPLKILGLFLLHLFVLCILFFLYNSLELGNAVSLFFKIIFFSLLPLLIIFSSLSFGEKITSYLPSINSESSIYKFLISIGIGFFSFIFILDILGILGFYNLYVVFLIIGGFITFSYKELIEIYKLLSESKIEIDIEEGSYMKLLSTEFLFLVSTLVLSISLISIVRPFPIGWDDLGAYMNFPHLMAEAGSIISLGGMQAWQTFTGIGYMFGSPTQAFFLNVVGGFLSFIALILIFTDLLKSKFKSFINIPLLVATVFISMPMIVFQQAKDMKLDAGLFFISIVSLYLLYKYYLKNSNNEEGIISKIKEAASFSPKGERIQERGFLLTILIIGLLAGFAFSIKFTSLLLISAMIGIIFYVRLGLIGLVGYLAMFFALFTKADLWSKMNVVVNPDKIIGLETTFSLISVILGLGLFLYSIAKHKGIIKKFFLELGVFILGIIIALLPWISQNIVVSYPNVSIGTILGGTPEKFDFDKTLILSDKELVIIENNKVSKVSSEGTTTNEDFGRYIGYEKGVNNYLKLPWNLTMQVNQGGEFTDIGFLFLALLPTILLFLPFRRKAYPYLIVLVLIFELLLFIKTDNKLIENNDLPAISENIVSSIFVSNQNIFKDKIFNKDIYDIKVTDYISRSDINKLVNDQNSFETINNKAIEMFYKELQAKVLNDTLGKDIVLTKTSLRDKDYNYILELRELASKYIVFKSNIDSIASLNDVITKLGIEESREELVSIWNSNKTFNQNITDFLSKFNLPLGYAIVLLVFLAPVLFLLFLLDSDKNHENGKLSLFKLNLIFASFYTFLWTISAFGIVWYGITMYFSFLLAIGIGLYYLSSYKDEDSENIFFIKLFGSLIALLIFLIYIVNSVFPHSFNNLKGAGYDKYKTGKITTTNASFLYHPEYLKILYSTNIHESKREDFLKEYINDDIEKLVKGITKMDIYSIKSLLSNISKQNTSKYIETKNSIYLTTAKSADKSLDNLYKYIANPTEEYKNKTGIYRIGTFLKYHISENNKRLLEDSLVFKFNDYIYSNNINTTVENFKKLGLSYLLVDLNAATIDKDERHNLTKRYERLLNTFTSEKLELIETDSICLKIALEDFSKSDKFSADRVNFMTIAGVNYESYTEEGKTISRSTKLLKCFNIIEELLNEDKINNTDYRYLLNIKKHISANKDAYDTENTLYTFLQQQVKHGYKVLFKIK